MSIKWWMEKENDAYLYNGILFSHKQELSTDTLYNVDELWKHANWKKPDTKAHVPYDSISVAYHIQNRQIHKNRKKICDL